ncbi:armadillo-type protein [Polychytrium aggregatum]|uniref:armadillo-type protein n=1 Tax=Polychytrium aggregatum TaxID=110093 RepID=UPI0022FE80E2|nr:armadillo-type protein [Polychytrium aggregatum]KAI9204326.1 armadillo-type protein [Polychytrium aggregatum]
MDLPAIARIVEAVEVIYSPLASHEQRKTAESFCEDLKHDTNAPLYGHYLAHRSSGQSDTVRHLGLSMLEDAVRYKWDNYDDPTKLKLREMSIDLVKAGTKGIEFEKNFIKEKIVRIFVEIAKRQWPWEWPDMDLLIQELYRDSPTTQELSLMIYRSLAEDVFIYEDAVAELRKRELTAIMLSVSMSSGIIQSSHLSYQEQKAAEANGAPPKPAGRTDMELLFKYMQTNPQNVGWLNKWTTACAQLHEQWHNLTAIQNADSSMVECLLVRHLNTVVVFLDWVWLRSIIEAEVASRVCPLLLSTSRSIRMGAVECLLVLFSKNINLADENRYFAILKPVFVDNNLGIMAKAWTSAHGSQDINSIDILQQTLLVSEDNYPFLKRLAQALVAVGERQICIKKNDSTPPLFESYLAMLMVVFDHPSLLVASSAAYLWPDFLKHTYFKKSPQVLACISKLLGGIPQKLLLTNQANLTEASEHYNQIDFDTAGEYFQFASSFRMKCLEIIKQAVQLEPSATFLWICSEISAIMTDKPSPSELNALGYCRGDSKYYLRFQNLCVVLESIVSALSKDAIFGDSKDAFEIRNYMTKLCDMLITYEYMDPRITKVQLSMIASLVDVLGSSREHLLKALHKLFTFVSFVMVDEVDNVAAGRPLRDETFELRVKAASCLVRVGTAMPDALMGLYPDIAAAVDGLISSPAVTLVEKTLLHEFKASIIFYSSIEPAQRTYLWNQIMDPCIKVWAETISVGALSSGEELYRLLGMDSLDVQGQGSGIHGDALLLKGTLHTIVRLLKRTVLCMKSSPERSTGLCQLWTPYYSRMLPGICAVLHGINELWCPPIRQRIPVYAAGIFDIADAEKLAIMGSSSHTRPSLADPNASDSRISNIRSWMSTVREYSYSALGLLSSFGLDFYNYLSMTQDVVTHVLAGAEFMDNRHWKPLIAAFLRPLIQSCPPQMYQSVLGSFLPSVMTFIQQKLDMEWQARDALPAVAPNDEDEEDQVSTEVVLEKLLRDLTRTYSELLCSFFALPTSKIREELEDIDRPEDTAETGVAAFANESLVRFLIENIRMVEPLLSSIYRLITYHDNAAASRALTTGIRILRATYKDPKFHHPLGNGLLKAVLQNLHDGYHQPEHPQAIALITELYVRLRPQTQEPATVFLSLPNTDEQAVASFESRLLAATTAKEQQIATQGFLQSITGSTISKLFQKQASFVLRVPEKELLARPPPDIGRNDIFDATADSEVLGQLFES